MKTAKVPLVLLLQLALIGGLWAADLPVVTIDSTGSSASEQGPKAATFVLKRSGDLRGQTRVQIQYSGTAQYYYDYRTSGNVVVFEPGENVAVLVINPVPDNLFEGAETVTATVVPFGTYDNLDAGILDLPPARAPSYQIGTPSSATCLIADNVEAATRPVSLTILPKQLFTEEGSSVPASFVLRRTGPTERGLAVGYDLQQRRVQTFPSDGGSGIYVVTNAAAISGVDYRAMPSVITFNPGQSEVVVPIVALPDTLREGWEHVTLRVRRSADYAVDGVDLATVFIGDPKPAANQPPSVRLVSPVAFEVIPLSKPTLPLRAVAIDTDGKIAKVEFLVDGAVVAVADKSEPDPTVYLGNWSRVTDGFHHFSVRATDDLGLATTTAPVLVQVFVANRPPVATVSFGGSPPAYEDRNRRRYVYQVLTPFDLKLKVRVSDPDADLIQRAELWVNGRLVGVQEHPAESFEMVAPDLGFGVFEFEVKIVDSRGAVGFGQLENFAQVEIQPAVSHFNLSRIQLGFQSGTMVRANLFEFRLGLFSFSNPVQFLDLVEILVDGQPAVSLRNFSLEPVVFGQWALPIVLRGLQNGPHTLHARVHAIEGGSWISQPAVLLVAAPLSPSQTSGTLVPAPDQTRAVDPTALLPAPGRTGGVRIAELWFESRPLAVESDQEGRVWVSFSGIPLANYSVEVLDSIRQEWQFLTVVESGTGIFTVPDPGGEPDSGRVYRARRLF